MFYPVEGSTGRLKEKSSKADISKENLDTFGNPQENSGAGVRSSGSKLGLSNLNVLNSNFARFEEKVALRGFDEDVQEKLSSTRSLTRIKARPTAATSFTKTSQSESSNEVPRDESQAQDLFISEFVSSVPRSRQDVSLQDDLPPLPGFYPPPPMFILPSPFTPPCSPYLPPNYPIFVPSLDQAFSSPSVSSLSASPPFAGITASVEQEGFIRLKLNYGVVLDLNTSMGIRLKNPSKDSSITLSDSTKHAAVIHPKGRVLIYEPRVEVQTEDDLNVKNAKIYPRGISFTANNMALVYLLDEAGARSTSDMFHDLYATNIVDTLFGESCPKEDSEAAVQESIKTLDEAQYWRTEAGVDSWIFKDVFIQQTMDGLVIVERRLEGGGFVSIKASPSNGKIRLNSDFVQVTASLGEESHLFLRSKDRRLHYNGGNGVFTVRNAGHSAGFDEGGELRIF